MNFNHLKRQAAARDLTANEVLRILDDAEKENFRLQSALSFIASHESAPGSALETVVKFARLTLDGVK